MSGTTYVHNLYVLQCMYEPKGAWKERVHKKHKSSFCRRPGMKLETQTIEHVYLGVFGPIPSLWMCGRGPLFQVSALRTVDRSQ